MVDTGHTNYTGFEISRADFKFAPSQWETALLCNDVSHWLGASLTSAPNYHRRMEVNPGIYTCQITLYMCRSSFDFQWNSGKFPGQLDRYAMCSWLRPTTNVDIGGKSGYCYAVCNAIKYRYFVINSVRESQTFIILKFKFHSRGDKAGECNTIRPGNQWLT